VWQDIRKMDGVFCGTLDRSHRRGEGGWGMNDSEVKSALHAQMMRERFFRDRLPPEAVVTAQRLTNPSALLSRLLQLTAEGVESGQTVENVMAEITKNLRLRGTEDIDDFAIWQVAVRNRYIDAANGGGA
jgi:hypothetical protein